MFRVNKAHCFLGETWQWRGVGSLRSHETNHTTSARPHGSHDEICLSKKNVGGFDTTKSGLKHAAVHFILYCLYIYICIVLCLYAQ